jgi:hypothetical protein
MWRCVDLALTDISEERIASIFRVEKWRQIYKATKVNARYWVKAHSAALDFFPIPDQSSAAYRPPSATCWFDLQHTLPLSSLLISHVAYSPSLPVLI